MLAALNTGHDGGLTTVHANAAAGVPARLEALAGLPRPDLHAQVAAALDVCVHLCRGRDGVRRVRELSVFVRGADGLVQVVPALDGPGHAALVALLAARGEEVPE